MAKSFKVGIIGSGGIARAAHLPAWAVLKDRGVEVVAVADINKENAEKAAAEFKVPEVHTDYRKLLARKQLDAVSICTPAALHREHAVAALERGVHVLCEKPLCLSSVECADIAVAVKKSGKLFMTAQHQRFTGEAQALKRYVADGSLGDVYYVHARALRRRTLPALPTFMFKKLSGGGPLLDIGVHILDLAWWLMGKPRPVTVSGVTHNKMVRKGGKIYNSWGEWDPKKTDVEDFACGLVRFDTGAVLYLETSFILNMKERSVFTATLHGTEAGAQWPDCEIFSEKSKLVTDTRITNVNAKVNAHHAEVAAFFEAIQGKKPSPVPISETRWVIAMLEGLYRSAEHAAEIRLKQ
jgi:predicted dehydrogenase